MHQRSRNPPARFVGDTGNGAPKIPGRLTTLLSRIQLLQTSDRFIPHQARSSV
ncbi:hypothetical protein ACQ4M4_02725 [Leptolyngbya sp. AN02str]|uniref:hypothetical protein n=1 Tax=Leptolyngbya sp. AN02str TaxID=3423363 RepID=UPI003D31DC80